MTTFAWKRAAAAAFSLALYPMLSDAAVGAPKVSLDHVAIPAGPSVQGSNRGEDDERPQRVKKLPAFRLDRTEVTRAAYARCVAARRCEAVPELDARAVERPTHPVTNVTWAQAQAYCRYVKGQLPTEAQWEKAARGALGRIYPWGDELSCRHANWGNFANEGPCAAENPGLPMPVASFPSGGTPEGVMDLAGNVWEWVQDSYESDKERRVVKGGSCCSYFVEPRASNRNAWAPTYHDADLGFRCAYK